MANIDTGGGHGGKKSVDQEIPLVPFIDLLLCCVMFLLVTAVWNQLARLDANQQQPGPARTQDQLPPEHLGLQERRNLEQNRRDIIVAPEDGVRYEDIIHAMDIAVGEGFQDLTLSDGASLL